MASATSRDAAATLAAAFHGGALFSYVEPDPDRRARRLPPLFEGTVLHCRRLGGVEVRAAGDEPVAAVAGWVPGHRLALTPADLVRTGLVTVPARLGPAATRRLERHERPTERRLLASVTDATAYLWVLGTRPEQQGRGLGGAALDAVLAAMGDAGFERCLLRTDDAGNVPFYQRHGFGVVEECEALPSGLPAWIMARPLF